ncbi:BRCT domain [Phaffia rhodozyma]|uniref:BRCT domain n=1 Tax=Phaffia rhodozyma TaxID=264483 RepID=A0A0F7SEG9_PHARH|nr:BRCT domain [Phaffia rhodozyma]
MQQDSLPRTRSSQKRHRSQSSSQETNFEETFSYNQSEVLVPPPVVRDNGVFQAIGSSSQSQRLPRNMSIVNPSRPSSTLGPIRSKSMVPEVLSAAVDKESLSKSSYGSQSQPISYDQTSVYDQSLSQCIHSFARDPGVLQALGYNSQITHSDHTIYPYSAPANVISDETFPRSLFNPALEESLLELDTSITQGLESPSKSSHPPRLPSPAPTNSDRQSSDSPASVPSAFAPSTTPPLLPDDPSQTKDLRSHVLSSFVGFDGTRSYLSSDSTVSKDITLDESGWTEGSAGAENKMERGEEEEDSAVFYEKTFDASSSLKGTQQTQTNEWETTPARTQVDTQVDPQNVGTEYQQALSPLKKGGSSKNRIFEGSLLERSVAEDRAKRSLVSLNKRRRINSPKDYESNPFLPLKIQKNAPVANFHHALDTPKRPEQFPATSSKQTIVTLHVRSPGLALTSEDTFIPATSSPLHVDSYSRSNLSEGNHETFNSSDVEDATNLSKPMIHHPSSSGFSSRPSTWSSVLDKSKPTGSSHVKDLPRSLLADEAVQTQSTLSSLPPSSLSVPVHTQPTSLVPSFIYSSPDKADISDKGGKEEEEEEQQQQKEEDEYVFGSTLPPQQLVSTQSSELSNPPPSRAVSKSQVTQNNQGTLESDSSLSTIPSETESSLSELLTIEADHGMNSGQSEEMRVDEDVQMRRTRSADKKETATASSLIRTRQRTKGKPGLPDAPTVSSLTDPPHSKRVQDSDRTLPNSQPPKQSISNPTTIRMTRCRGQLRLGSRSASHSSSFKAKQSNEKDDDCADSDQGEEGRDDTIECADDTVWRTEGFSATALSMATAMTTRSGNARPLSAMPTIDVPRRTRLVSSESSRLRRTSTERPSVDDLQLQQLFASGRVQRVFGLYKDSGSFWPGMIVEARFFGDYLLNWDEPNSKPSNINIRDLRKCMLRKGDVVWSSSNGAHQFIVAEDYDSPEGIGPDTEISVSLPDQVLERTLRGKVTLKMRDIVIDRLNVPQMDDRKLFTEDMYVQEPALLTFRPPVTPRTTMPVSSSNPSATGSGTARASSPIKNTRRSGSVDDVARPTKPGCFAGYGFIFTTPTLTEIERSKIQNTIVENGGLVGNDFQNFYHVINSSDTTSIQEELIYRKERKQDDLKAVFVLAEQPCRTPKYLKALALGIPCLATSYIQNAVSNGDGWRGYMLSTPFSEHLKAFGSQQFVHPSWSVDRSIVKTLILSTPSYIHRPFTNLTMLYLNPKKNERELVVFLCIALGAKSITTTSDLSDPSLSFIFKSFDILVVKDDLKPFPSRTTVGKKSGRLEIVNEEWVKQCSIVGQQVKRMPWKVTSKK